ncbi:MAG: thiolase family protein [Thermoplasmata archaeon]
MEPSPRPRVAILGAVRTPIGKYGGALKATPATELGRIAISAALLRAGLATEDVPEVYMGHCIQAGTGQNPARQAARGAGIPDHAGAATINMVCGSGLKAVMIGVAAIRSGTFPLVVAGGMESMSSAPYLVPSKARWGLRAGNYALEDAVLRDALLDAYDEHEHMGFTGERIARKFRLSREEVDAFALRSHQRASAARTDGRFNEEIVPVPPDPVSRGPGLPTDEGPRADTTPERLARLIPSFLPSGLVTAGNSSQLSDGAAALILASEEEVHRRELRPLAWVHSGEVGGVSPAEVMEAPLETVRRHLTRVGLRAADIDRWEQNEAFASEARAFQRTFEIPDERYNVLGGAVALGHPIGASGARIVVTLVHEMRRSSSRLGIAALCMGGGNGLSLLVERADA